MDMRKNDKRKVEVPLKAPSKYGVRVGQFHQIFPFNMKTDVKHIDSEMNGKKPLIIPDTFSEAKASEAVKAFNDSNKKEDVNMIQGLSNNNNAADANRSFASAVQEASRVLSSGSLESPGYLKIFISLVVNHGYGMFTDMAEKKLIKIMKSKLDSDVENLLSSILHGADEEFDKTINGLSSVSCFFPKAMIDALMLWRRNKSDLLEQIISKRLQRGGYQQAQELSFAQDLYRDKKSLVLNVVLTRALCAILESFKNNDYEQEIVEKLEDMCFNHILNNDFEITLRSQFKKWSFDLFCELLSHLASIRFVKVIDHFILELEKLNESNETSLEAISDALKFIKVPVYPVENFEEASNFIWTICGKFATSSDSIRIKFSFSQAIIQLCQSIAENASAELNLPFWTRNIESIIPKIEKMTSKPKFMPLALRLYCMTLSVSPAEIFTSKWQGAVDMCISKFKDKTVKEDAMLGFIRLLWVYLFRVSESSANTMKRLDNFIKLFFPSNRKIVNPSEVSIDLFVQMIHMIGCRVPEYTLRNFFPSLLNLDEPFAGIDTLDCDRVLIGIKSFNLIMNSLILNKGKVPFPSSLVGVSPIGKPLAIFHTKRLRYSDQELNQFSLSDASRKINDFSATLVNELDKFLDAYSDLKNVTDHSIKYGPIDLLETLFDCVPSIMPGNKDIQSLLLILTKYSGDRNEKLSKSASKAFRSIIENCHDLLVPAVKFSGNYVIHVGDSLESHLEKHLNEYISMLRIVEDVVKLNAPNLSQINKDTIFSSSHEYDIVKDLESKSITFLCSTSRRIRSKALELASIAHDIDQILLASNGYTSILRSSKLLANNTRLQSIYDEVALEIIESHIYSKCLKGTLKSDQRNISKGLAFKLDDLALETEDNLIWDATLEKLFDRLHLKCPELLQQSIIHIHKRFQALTPFVQTENVSTSTISSFGGGTIKIATVTGSSRTGGTLRNNLSLLSSGNPKVSNFLSGLESDDISVQWCKYLLCLFKSIREDFEEEKGFKPIKTSPISNLLRDILRIIGPYLSAEKYEIRKGVSEAISHCHWTVFHVVFDYLRPLIDAILEDFKGIRTSKTISSKKPKRLDILRIEITFILNKLCPLFSHSFCRDESYLNYFCIMVKGTREYLSHTENILSQDWDSCVILRNLYCALVESLYAIFNKTGITSSLFSFEFRVSQFADLEDWCGYGSKRSMIREREAKMMALVLDQARDMKERGHLVKLMEEQRKGLELQALKTMVALCKGPLYDVAASGSKTRAIDRKFIFQWVTSILLDPNESVHVYAREALVNILVTNDDIPSFIDEAVSVIFQTSNAMKSVSKGFFLSLKSAYEKISLSCRPATLLILAFFKIGDPDNEVRIEAFNMLKLISTRNISAPFPFQCAAVSNSPHSIVYLKSVNVLSDFLASSLPTLAHEMVCELALRLDIIKDNKLESLILCLSFWMSKIKLSLESDGLTVSVKSAVIIHNLFYITAFCDSYQGQIEELWSILGRDEGNIRPIVNFFTRASMEKRNPSFLTAAGKIFCFLARNEKACNYVCDVLASNLVPKAMIVPRTAQSYQDFIKDGPDFVANLDYIYASMPRNAALNTGQICSIFLSQIFSDKIELALPYIPLLLHTIFIHIDHFNEYIFDSHQNFLFTLVQGFRLKFSDEKSLLEIEKTLNKDKLTRLWVYEDVNLNRQDLFSTKQISKLTRLSLKLFVSINPNITEEWGLVALKWATTCPVRHLASRSLQIYRELAPEFTLSMLADLLARLSNTISSNVEDIQSFALDLLITMNSMVNMITVSNLRVFPQFFWSCIVCLKSPLMHEYREVVLILGKIFSNTRFETSDMEFIMSNIPESLKMEFDGLQPLLLKGLTTSLTLNDTISLFKLLMKMGNSELIDRDNQRRLLHQILVLIPPILMHEEALDSMNLLALVSGNLGFGGVQKYFESLIANNQSNLSNSDLAKGLANMIRHNFPVEMIEKEAFPFLIQYIPVLRRVVQRDILAIVKLLTSGRRFYPREDDSQNIAISLVHLINSGHLTQEAMEILNNVIVPKDFGRSVNIEIVEKVINFNESDKLNSISQTPTSSVFPVDSMNSKFSEFNSHSRAHFEYIIQQCRLRKGMNLKKSTSKVFRKSFIKTEDTESRAQSAATTFDDSESEDNYVDSVGDEEKVRQIMTKLADLDMFFSEEVKFEEHDGSDDEKEPPSPVNNQDESFEYGYGDGSNLKSPERIADQSDDRYDDEAREDDDEEEEDGKDVFKYDSIVRKDSNATTSSVESSRMRGRKKDGKNPSFDYIDFDGGDPPNIDEPLQKMESIVETNFMTLGTGDFDRIINDKDTQYFIIIQFTSSSSKIDDLMEDLATKISVPKDAMRLSLLEDRVVKATFRSIDYFKHTLQRVKDESETFFVNQLDPKFKKIFGVESRGNMYELCDEDIERLKQGVKRRGSSKLLTTPSEILDSDQIDKLELGNDSLLTEIGFWSAIIEKAEQEIFSLELFPFSFQIALSFFNDLIEKVRDHINSGMTSGVSDGRKRIKRIVKNLQLLMEIPYDPLFESIDSVEFLEFHGRYKDAGQKLSLDPKRKAEFEKCCIDWSFNLDEILYDLILSRRKWMNIARSEESDRKAHFKYCLALCEVCQGIIQLYSNMIEVQQLVENLIGTKPTFSMDDFREKTKQSTSFNDEIMNSIESQLNLAS